MKVGRISTRRNPDFNGLLVAAEIGETADTLRSRRRPSAVRA